MNLLIISHTPHYLHEGQVVGWGPTVREIDHLATLFERVTHLGVLYDEAAPKSSLPYTARNVHLLPIRPAGGAGWRDKLGVVQAYPGYWKTVHRALSTVKTEDIVHVRCPANLSLLAVMYLAISRKFPYRWIKYAGNWQPNGQDSITYSLQRKLLNRNLTRSLVTVNGTWPGQPPHILSFRNPSLERADILEGRQTAQSKRLTNPIQFLFVGALETGKGVFEAIEVARRLAAAGFDFELKVIGDGSQRSALEELVKNARLERRVYFCGWVPKTELAHFYCAAHFNILPTRSEGWPKVLSEGMAYGVVPLAGAVSSIPQTLQACGTGMALQPSDSQAFVNGILSYVKDPQRWKRESEAACRAASQFTYEAYLEHLKDIFADHWGVAL